MQMDGQLLLHDLLLEAVIGSGELAGVAAEKRDDARLQTGVAVGRRHWLLPRFARESLTGSGHEHQDTGQQKSDSTRLPWPLSYCSIKDSFG
jgi:hypothetical protein